MKDTNEKNTSLLVRWINGTLTEEETIRLKSDPEYILYGRYKR